MKKYFYVLLISVSILIVLNRFLEIFIFPNVLYAISYIVCGTSLLIVTKLKRNNNK